MLSSSSVRAKAVAAAVAVAALSAGCTSSKHADGAAASAPATAGSAGSQGPQPARQFTLPAPTCGPAGDGGDPVSTGTTLRAVQNSVTQWSYRKGSDRTLISGEEKSGPGPGLEYRITDCATDRAPMLMIMGVMTRTMSEVDSPPGTLAECATRTPEALYTWPMTPLPVDDLIGKRLCFSDHDDNAYYFRIEAAGPPNAAGAPDLKVTVVAYGTPSTE
ncbi:hypothetical protein ABTZ03_40340 [Kitasatospora sp. NPDC096077]|uniref:hypothetical protein n=1 Tax=Kitasatospora sp. NPDC096077 TaxID=3155544 RepID=UPI00332C7E42